MIPTRRTALPLPGPAWEMLAKMRQTVDDPLGLLPALQNYVEQWSAWSGIAVNYQAFGFERAEERLPYEIGSTMYRIIQEALTNVLRHASSHTLGLAASSTTPPGQTRARSGRSNRSKAVRTGSASGISVSLHRTARQVIASVEEDGAIFDVQGTMSLPQTSDSSDCSAGKLERILWVERFRSSPPLAKGPLFSCACHYWNHRTPQSQGRSPFDTNELPKFRDYPRRYDSLSRTRALPR